MITLSQIESVIRRGPYTDTWDSLKAWTPPAWYQGLKFGIFIHWGVYSVPAFANEWYPRNMYIRGSREFEHHVNTWGPHKDFGYKDFIPLFKAEKFDPEAWAQLFQQSGAQYVIPVGEHHDGFQMYRSEISRYNAAEMGPGRNVVPEVTAACARRGLTCGTSSHRIEHWFYLSHGRDFASDFPETLKKGDLYWPSMPDPKDMDDFDAEPAPDAEYLDDWLLRTCEMIDVIRPRILYFDWWIAHRKAAGHLRKIAAYYYNRAAEWGTGAVINYKHNAFPEGGAVPDVERGQLADAKPYLWQSDTSTALNSWCWTTENRFRDPVSLVRDLVDIVSKNGRLLLNVGPKADGTICDEDRRILTAIGDWLMMNGEAVKPAKPWKIFGEGPTSVAEGQFTEGQEKPWCERDFRFTRAGDAVYAIAMKPSPEGVYRVKSLGGEPVRDVSCLGGAAVNWRQGDGALEIKAKTIGDMPVVFKVRL